MFHCPWASLLFNVTSAARFREILQRRSAGCKRLHPALARGEKNSLASRSRLLGNISPLRAGIFGQTLSFSRLNSSTIPAYQCDSRIAGLQKAMRLLPHFFSCLGLWSTIVFFSPLTIDVATKNHNQSCVRARIVQYDRASERRESVAPALDIGYRILDMRCVCSRMRIPALASRIQRLGDAERKPNASSGELDSHTAKVLFNLLIHFVVVLVECSLPASPWISNDDHI